jgi:carbamoyltransferase
MKILGVSCFFHDSAATLLIDGKIVAAGAEERFSRLKHDNTFPKLAIDYCLNEAGIAINEVDAVVFYEQPIKKFSRILHQHLQYFPKSLPTFLDTTGAWLNQKMDIQSLLKEELNYFGPVSYVPHHLSHSASAFYLSGFKTASIVTLDGVGEWATTTLGYGKGNSVVIDKEIHFPHSLGLLYSAITAYLGFAVNNDEYKVMGLAPYGNPKPFREHLKKLIELHDDGSYSLNMEYFDYGWSQHMISKKMEDLFGHPVRKGETRIAKYHANIAASLQELLEIAVINLLNEVYRSHPSQNLCLAGGVALNSVMNAKILGNTPFKKIYIPPDPSDAGGSMGAALYYYFDNAHKKQKIAPSKTAQLFTPYLGPRFHWHQIESKLEEYGLSYKYFKDNSEMLTTVADYITKKKVIGWFQGRMEWGPRALGNRSILAAATSPEMKDIINAKVKHRELFRPFAPVILEEHVEEYFYTDKPLPESAKYMLFVYPFTEGGKDKIPSVVHVDNTGRLQSLSRKDNPLYYDLIDAYYKKTGIPVIINTSFNVRGEPIVCTPEDAIKCFLGTEIDYLVIDNFVISKRKNGRNK